VTGLAALMLSKDKTLKPDLIRDIIRDSADKLPQLADKVNSGGKVNAYAALATLDRRTLKTPIRLAKSEPKFDALKEQLRKISSKKKPIKPAVTKPASSKAIKAVKYPAAAF
jgi:hypothetical protein